MKDQKKNILIVTSEFPPQPGGIGNHAYNLAKNLALNNFKVSVIADQRSEFGKVERKFDSELNFSIYRVKLTRIRAFMYIKRIILLFKYIKQSTIVIASGKYPIWIVAFTNLFYKRQIIAIVHGSEVNFSNKILAVSIRKSLQRFHKIIAVSNYTKSLMSAINFQNTVVIPNGFDAENWQTKNIQPKDLKGNPKLITVGNVTVRKGQLNVIEHLPELIKKYPNLHYHCVGIPTQKEMFLEAAESLKVKTHITFHGQVSNQELKELLQSSDIFVMLSSPAISGDVEGFGIAIIEANYLGLPCIGSNNCGIEDAIDDYKSGILIPHDNSAAIITAIQDVLANYEVYKTYSKKWAMQHDWSKIIKTYVKEISL